MVNISIDVTDLGGAARPGDKVVFWRPRMGGSATHAGRVISTAPVTVFLTDGKATVSDVEPGEMAILLQCRGVESQGPVTVGVPDGNGTVTLRALLESQFEYAPPIVSAVQEAASNASASEEAAIRAQVRSEAAADRADAKVDDAINNGAELVRDEVKQDADRAVSARQAATQSESNAKASEGAAASSASRAKTSETNAKQSETNAGDYAAVATTAATEAVDAMERATEVVGGDFATHEYVDAIANDHESRLAPLEDDSSNAVSVINSTGGYAGRLVRLNQDGKLDVHTSSITELTDVANKRYVDTSWTRLPNVTGDLDNITTPGVYKLAVSEEATLENHYPEPGVTGILEVFAIGGGSSFPIQRVTTRSDMPRIYVRRHSSAGWLRWHAFTSDSERSIQEFTTLGPDGYYAPAGQKLTLPTHDGSGQATHPSVLHFPEGFNGYRYWMAVTPFPNANDDHEDPNILASQDGTTWVVPDGLTNPLDDAPGNPDYNSDTCLSMGPNSTMWCFWRLRGASTGSEVIYGRSTTDGVTWTPREEIIRNDDADGKLNRLLSPSLVYDPRGAGSWRLWVINTSDSTTGEDRVKLKHSTGPTGWNFTAWQDVTVAPLQDRYRPWHMSVRYVEGKYVGILCASDSLAQATYDNLMVVGNSPTDFRVSSMPSIERTSAQHTSLYQSSMVPVVTPSGLEWDVFYSGIYASTNTWNVFRTRMGRRTLGSLRDSIEEKLTPPDSGWRDISDTLREGWAGEVKIRRIGWEIFIELDKVTRESGNDHRMINLPRFGFLPSFNIKRGVLTTSRKPVELSLYTWVGDLGSIQVTGREAGDIIRGGFSFLTSDEPPSKWPGVPIAG